ncbi:hypothetical protein GCM10007276_17710 [Agaricicola taiwanensis]|uniref:SH3b domain-containing protein n=1 Tax=Agaricicola taiwanensis TaxID=591372 RepID=A0A8J2YGR9_9RHOB|nr:SH3 domain-containing protein [Agaricicola taiwanensis]GGE40800.1 hypothetical protein GCM10007276_17710 [Agaricicola taiwanensis]
MTLSLKHLLVAGATSLATATSALAVPANVTADLNLRQGPGTAYAPVATIPRGDMVEVVDCQGAWCEIGWRGYGGFASRSYLAYDYRGPRRYAPAPVVVMPPPPPPPGPVIYSVPYYDPPIYYRGGGVGLFFGF